MLNVSKQQQPSDEKEPSVVLADLKRNGKYDQPYSPTGRLRRIMREKIMPSSKNQGLPRYRFFPADTYGVVFQLGGIFLAVPGTAKYGGTDFGGSRYGKILLSSIERKNWHDRKE